MDGRKPEVVMLIVIMAAGTGGHVFPGLAMADELRARGHEVIWLGSPRGLEQRLVPAAGLVLEQIDVAGVRGKHGLGLLFAPLRIVRALWQSVLILRRLQPAIVLGMGGFVSGPGGLAAWLLRIPLCIHEQNAIAGLTNRWLSRLARRVLVAFPGTLTDAGDKVTEVGNPVRSSLHNLPAPDERFAGRRGLRLLIVGGSQGAHRLNQVVPAAVGQLQAHLGAENIEVWHQTGERDADLVQRNYVTLNIHARVAAFIDDMAAAYSWADLVICRAGALTLAELTAAGLGAVLVPFPYAVDDHQTANARWLSQAGGAVLIQEQLLTPATLASQLQVLGSDRAKLIDMANKARALARPQAAQQIADICLEVAHADAA